ncbi:MAG: signal recognition particle, SRP9/SRP14 subunit [Monoraphidium minutum]|nr:MAG: signal recognition particle, SRP9/SRP14 subunit [Monoraphidium minutum]
MYIDDWDSFYVQAEELWRRQPLKARYCVKYRHAEGKLVLKVTDDTTCLKYATDQLVDVKRMEKLNNLMFLLMARGADAAAGG